MRAVVLILVSLVWASWAFAQEPFHQVCGACHTTVAEDFRSHPHLQQGLDCNVCHGESQAHRNAAGAAQPDRIAAPHEVPSLCGSCHVDQLASFSKSRHGELTAAKERAPNCGTCHDVHRVRPALAVERRCASCHRERPAACSADPPAGVTAGVSCAACHQPHEFRGK
jgi:hypothetical protein